MKLQPTHLATICAALQYWQEEMCPHSAAAMTPYLPSDEIDVLSTAEVEQLRLELLGCELRYAILDPGRPQFALQQLLAESDLEAARSKKPLVTWPR